MKFGTVIVKQLWSRSLLSIVSGKSSLYKKACCGIIIPWNVAFRWDEKYTMIKSSAITSIFGMKQPKVKETIEITSVCKLEY
jgi:hypothetical protein